MTRYSLAENPTVFGKILRGELPCRKVYEDDHVLAFHDIAPRAPIHVILIPKAHLGGLHEATAADATLLGHLLGAVPAVAEAVGVRTSGFRLISNAGVGGGQEVPHLHLQLLADPSGKPLPGF